MSNNLKVAVITLNYNQNKYTFDAINSILESTFTNFNIFLLDNGSTWDNYRKLRNIVSDDDRINIKRIEKNIVYVGEINAGFKFASEENPDYYLIINNDTKIKKMRLKN